MRHKIFQIALGVLAALLAASAPAMAQIANDSQIEAVFSAPQGTDLFMHLLSYVMPGVGPIPDNGNGTDLHLAIKNALMVFNATLLLIGAAIVSWHLLSGMVASAKEGSVLGKRYHEVWAPMRIAIGFGMLVPAAGGLCAAQILVIWFMAWGGNIANVVWSPYIDAVTYQADAQAGDASKRTLSGANMALANDAVFGLMEKNLCYAAISTFNTRMEMAGSPTYPLPALGGFQEVESSWWGTTFAGQSDTYRIMDFGEVCGRLEVSVTKAGDEGDRERTAARTLDLARVKALETIQPILARMANEIAQTYQSPDAAGPAFQVGSVSLDAFKYVREVYTTTISNAAVQVYNSSLTGGATGPLDEMRTSAKGNGWASAGVFYLSVSRLQSEIYSAGAKGVTFTAFYPEAMGYHVSETLMQYLTGTDTQPGVLPAFEAWWKTNVRKIAPDLSATVAATDSASGSFNAVLNQIFGGIVGLWTDHEVDPMNAMQSTIDFGNRMMLYGVGSYAAATGVQGGVSNDSIVGTVMNKVPLIGGGARELISGVSGLAATLSLGIIAAGAVHAYILPLLPFVLMAFFVASMVLLFVEALVAAPLWAFMHMRMDGDEFVADVQRPGYMIAFNLILRPVLAIFGLMLSMLTFGAMMWFMSKTFWPVAQSLSASSAIGPIGAVVLIAMVTFLDYQIAIRSFQLVTTIPDRVTRWFGQGGDRLGENEDGDRNSAFLVQHTTGKLDAAKAAPRAPGSGVGKKPSPTVPTK